MKLRYTHAALADLGEVLDYIAERSPNGAKRVHKRLHDLIELLVQHPGIGARSDDPAIRRVNIAPYPYLIFYETTADAVIIHAIRHGSRDPSTMPVAPKP